MPAIPFIAAAAAVVGVVQGAEARSDAKRAAAASAEEARKIKREQVALNAQQQSQERRAQIREERVKRARILQGAENTGAVGSSGEFGALGSLSTQLGSNLGINAGRAAAGERVNEYSQNAANFDFARASATNDANNADALFNLSTKIYDATKGGSTPKSTPAPEVGESVSGTY